MKSSALRNKVRLPRFLNSSAAAFEKMGFAEAKSAMDVEQRNIGLLAFGESARRANGRIRWPGQE